MGELTGTVVTPDLSYPGRVRFGGRIEAVEALAGSQGRYLLPGFVDLHVHGGAGADFMEGEAAVRQAARFHAQHGTAALLATTVTAPIEDLEAALTGIHTVIQNPGPARPESSACIWKAPLSAPISWAPSRPTPSGPTSA